MDRLYIMGEIEETPSPIPGVSCGVQHIDSYEIITGKFFVNGIDLADILEEYETLSKRGVGNG